MENLAARLARLNDSLAEFPAGENTPWPLAVIFNVLLEDVKREHGDDPIVAAIEPLRQASGRSGTYDFTQTDCGTVRAMIMQLRAVV